MYAKLNTEASMDDCFAEKAKIWIWYAGFFMLASTGIGFALEKPVQTAKVNHMNNPSIKQVKLVAMQSRQPFYNTIIQAYRQNYGPYYSQNQRYTGSSAKIYPIYGWGGARVKGTTISVSYRPRLWCQRR